MRKWNLSVSAIKSQLYAKDCSQQDASRVGKHPSPSGAGNTSPAVPRTLWGTDDPILQPENSGLQYLIPDAAGNASGSLQQQPTLSDAAAAAPLPQQSPTRSRLDRLQGQHRSSISNSAAAAASPLARSPSAANQPSGLSDADDEVLQSPAAHTSPQATHPSQGSLSFGEPSGTPQQPPSQHQDQQQQERGRSRRPTSRPMLDPGACWDLQQFTTSSQMELQELRAAIAEGQQWGDGMAAAVAADLEPSTSQEQQELAHPVEIDVQELDASPPPLRQQQQQAHSVELTQVDSPLPPQPLLSHQQQAVCPQQLSDVTNRPSRLRTLGGKSWTSHLSQVAPAALSQLVSGASCQRGGPGVALQQQPSKQDHHHHHQRLQQEEEHEQERQWNTTGQGEEECEGQQQPGLEDMHPQQQGSLLGRQAGAGSNTDLHHVLGTVFLGANLACAARGGNPFKQPRAAVPAGTSSSGRPKGVSYAQGQRQLFRQQCQQGLLQERQERHHLAVALAPRAPQQRLLPMGAGGHLSHEQQQAESPWEPERISDDDSEEGAAPQQSRQQQRSWQGLQQPHQVHQQLADQTPMAGRSTSYPAAGLQSTTSTRQRLPDSGLRTAGRLSTGASSLSALLQPAGSCLQRSGPQAAAGTSGAAASSSWGISNGANHTRQQHSSQMQQQQQQDLYSSGGAAGQHSPLLSSLLSPAAGGRPLLAAAGAAAVSGAGGLALLASPAAAVAAGGGTGAGGQWHTPASTSGVAAGAAANVRPWWWELPDFVPVQVLAERGINPRDGQPVHIHYKHQFEESAPGPGATPGGAAAAGTAGRGRGTAGKQAASKRRRTSSAGAAGDGAQQGSGGWLGGAAAGRRRGSGSRGGKPPKKRRSSHGQAAGAAAEGAGGGSGGKGGHWRTLPGGAREYVDAKGRRLRGQAAYKQSLADGQLRGS